MANYKFKTTKNEELLDIYSTNTGIYRMHEKLNYTPGAYANYYGNNGNGINPIPTSTDQ